MTTIEQVKQCGDVREALLVLAAAIDALAATPADPFDAPLQWDDPGGHGYPSQAAAHGLVWTEAALPDGRAVIVDGDVVVQPVSGARQTARDRFAVDARLHEFYGDSLAPEDFLTAYRKGGPRWLYYTNRDCVMAMPVGVRQALVADVLLDSPSEAAEISADILKFDFDEGARENEGLEMQRINRELGPGLGL